MVRCLESKGFGVKLAKTCSTKSEEAKALADRAAGQFPTCAVATGSRLTKNVYLTVHELDDDSETDESA